MTGTGVLLVLGCAVAGGLGGAFVPAWISRLPEPESPPADDEPDEPDEPVEPKEPYVELARWPGLRPLAVALTAVSFGLLAWRLGADPALPAVLYLAFAGVLLGYVDLRVRLLPNAVVLPSYLVVGVLLTGGAAVSGQWVDLGWAAAGGASLWVFFAVLALIAPSGMGFGDVKLAGVLGLGLGWFGFGHVVVGTFAAFVLGGLSGLLLIAMRRAGRKSAIPFGPFLIVGFLVAVLVGDALVDLYLGR